MRLVEASVRPEDQARNILRPAPLEHRLHESAAGAAASQAAVQVEPMQLRAAAVETRHPDRADDHVVFTHDEEGAARRRVVLVEA